MDVYFVRHGQSAANAGLTDNLDSPLTPLGERQAALTADRLESVGITKIFVSPLLRTLQTVAPTCRRLDMHAVPYAELCEYFSPRYQALRTFKGLSPADISECFPFTDFQKDFRCPEIWWPDHFEDHLDIYARVSLARDEIYARFGNSEDKILIVSHAETIGRMIEAFMHTPPNPEGPPWSHNCGFSHLHVPMAGSPAHVIVINDLSHLQSITADAA